MTQSLRPLIAGNWKMHGTNAFASDLAGSLADKMSDVGNNGVEMLLCPPALLLGAVRASIGDSGISLGGQDCHAAEQGAHTGDTSAAMLHDAGCAYVIVGHSERRADHDEDDATVNAKASAAQTSGLVPVICIGETLEEREAGRAVEVVTGQLRGSIPEGSSAATMVVAYEPVWAIGTGRTPTLDDISEVHDAIRSALKGVSSDFESVRILYGGSVKPENASEILAVANVNGALVGGASLKSDDFWAIAEAAS
ncbi:MAG: triose-phosphate isomerase [Alphaproteobacteria bacterium]|nr:triose-phosphate isomerase [Alphaproteobacteria bacterium]